MDRSSDRVGAATNDETADNLMLPQLSVRVDRQRIREERSDKDSFVNQRHLYFHRTINQASSEAPLITIPRVSDRDR